MGPTLFLWNSSTWAINPGHNPSSPIALCTGNGCVVICDRIGLTPQEWNIIIEMVNTTHKPRDFVKEEGDCTVACLMQHMWDHVLCKQYGFAAADFSPLHFSLVLQQFMLYGTPQWTKLFPITVESATLCKQSGKRSGKRSHNHGNLSCEFNIPIAFQNGNWPLNYIFLQQLSGTVQCVF